MLNKFQIGDLICYRDWDEPLILITNVYSTYYTVTILGDYIFEPTDVNFHIVDENYTIKSDILRD